MDASIAEVTLGKTNKNTITSSNVPFQRSIEKHCHSVFCMNLAPYHKPCHYMCSLKADYVQKNKAHHVFCLRVKFVQPAAEAKHRNPITNSKESGRSGYTIVIFSPS